MPNCNRTEVGSHFSSFHSRIWFAFTPAVRPPQWRNLYGFLFACKIRLPDTKLTPNQLFDSLWTILEIVYSAMDSRTCRCDRPSRSSYAAVVVLPKIAAAAVYLLCCTYVYDEFDARERHNDSDYQLVIFCSSLWDTGISNRSVTAGAGKNLSWFVGLAKIKQCV